MISPKLALASAADVEVYDLKEKVFRLLELKYGHETNWYLHTQNPLTLFPDKMDSPHNQYQLQMSITHELWSLREGKSKPIGEPFIVRLVDGKTKLIEREDWVKDPLNIKKLIHWLSTVSRPLLG